MRSGRRVLSDYEASMDVLVGDFDIVYNTLIERREAAIATLENYDANVWARKRALNTVTQTDRAIKSLVNIMGAMEESCEYAKQLDDDFIPSTESELS